jgi:hypothetical protein
MDSTRHLPAARRMTSWKVAVLCSSAVLTAATWLASGPPGLNRVSPLTVSAAGMSEGQRLFDHETFGGNGRTCRTCHSGDDGTIDPAEVAERFFGKPLRAAVPSRWPRRLCQRHQPDYRARDDPDRTRPAGGRSPRGRPVRNLRRPCPRGSEHGHTPGLDPALMYDMRDLDLPVQASGAITRHAQATIAPTTAQLEAIAAFQPAGGSSSSMRRGIRPTRKVCAPCVTAGRC